MWARLRKYALAAGCLLALSIGVKIFAILLIPFFLLRQPLNFLVGLVITLLLLYFPFISHGSSDFSGLIHMSQNWEFNSALWGLARMFFSEVTTRIIIFGLLLFFLAYYFLHFVKKQTHNEKTIFRGDIVFGLFLICAPVINPWYLIWLLPFATIRPSFTAWAASVLVFMAYITPIYLPSLNLFGNYDQPLWARYFQFSLLGIIFVVEVFYKIGMQNRIKVMFK